MPILKSFRWSTLFIVGFLLTASAIIYLPGASGPFVFDDTTNFLDNTYTELRELTWENLWRAAYSVASGPLNRPIAMASFALNHYFAGGFTDTTPFKITNIVIHALNAILIFWLTYLVLNKLRKTYALAPTGRGAQNTVMYMAGGAALAWSVHPIQLTSVLYVVQRMTSLAALFTLLALVCYVYIRTRAITTKQGVVLATLGVIGFGALGVLTKESAILLPFFILVLEFVVFYREFPWSKWKTLERRKQNWILVVVAVTVAGLIVSVLAYAVPNYHHRAFNAWERVLTETRALWFYIFLILVPRLSEFGLYHDDFALSTSVIHPWTTLPAIIGIGILLFLSFRYRKRYPLASLGILWFFAGHALESTVISLELVHEHRNYLPSYGFMLVLLQGMVALNSRYRSVRQAVWLSSIVVLVFATLTTMRSMQWCDLNSLARYEALHHPGSPAAQNQLSIVLSQQNDHDGAMQAMRRAANIDKREVLFFINMHIIATRSKLPVTDDIRQEMLQILRTVPLSGSAVHALENLSYCVMTHCRPMAELLEEWIETALAKPGSKEANTAILHYILGRSLHAKGEMEAALKALEISWNKDPAYLHPRIEAVQLYLNTNRLAEAENALEELKMVNATSLHRRDKEIEVLEYILDTLRRGEQPPPMTAWAIPVERKSARVIPFE